MRLEPATKQRSLPDLIGDIELNGKIEIYADRLQTFKTTVARLNKTTGAGYKFDYSGIVDNYYTATRIA